ncbi:nuclear transport factor 2-like protein [Nesterenkonia haasae]|uniref:hypothetical protein n=1 Tax=Nesterenkonia haasae TaxID=2587813 RepID=UPI001390DDC4|nr:hypothetical protein [Nesterenkonia haasae]NDK32444.1 hypothetical protein [Nesterenkonia haasae]
MNSTRHPVPPSVRIFVEKHPQGPVPEVLEVFSPDAVVTDIEHADKPPRVGHDEIREWLADTAAAFSFKAHIIGSAQSTVEVRIEGDFPGRTADLSFAYQLDDAGRIARLDIG